MDLQAFTHEVNTWYRRNAPRDWRAAARTMTAEAYRDFQLDWLRELNTRGFAAPGVPTEYGGGGYSVMEQAIIHRAAAAHDAPACDLFEVSLNHVPGTFLAVGDERQRKQYIRPAIEGTVWCQGFSEPGAGSDLALLKTRAERVEGGWRVTGQKIWSSHAADARHCLLLARTDPSARRTRGITYFVLDMDAEGVTTRPIRQIPGTSEFCEIFLDDAFIPEQNVIGEVGSGWQVAQSTLSAERGPMALPTIERMEFALQTMLPPVQAGGGTLDDRGAAIAALAARQAAVRSLALDTVDLIGRGRDPGSLASLIKVSFSELLQDMTGLGTLLSPAASLMDAGSENALGYLSGYWTTDWLNSWAATIAGGANEIQRDIIAEKILDMPREPRPEAVA
jgi:alkylation response protein AidB-like acyl-CoA dehydrogenase